MLKSWSKVNIIPSRSIRRNLKFNLIFSSNTFHYFCLINLSIISEINYGVYLVRGKIWLEGFVPWKNKEEMKCNTTDMIWKSIGTTQTSAAFLPALPKLMPTETAADHQFLPLRHIVWSYIFLPFLPTLNRYALGSRQKDGVLVSKVQHRHTPQMHISWSTQKVPEVSLFQVVFPPLVNLVPLNDDVLNTIDYHDRLVPSKGNAALEFRHQMRRIQKCASSLGKLPTFKHNLVQVRLQQIVKLTYDAWNKANGKKCRSFLLLGRAIMTSEEPIIGMCWKQLLGLTMEKGSM